MSNVQAYQAGARAGLEKFAIDAETMNQMLGEFGHLAPTDFQTMLRRRMELEGKATPTGGQDPFAAWHAANPGEFRSQIHPTHTAQPNVSFSREQLQQMPANEVFQRLTGKTPIPLAKTVIRPISAVGTSGNTGGTNVIRAPKMR